MKEDIYQRALLLEKEGDWDGAHRLIQDLPTPEAAWIHAYLHRREGDDGNARYWYNRAGKDFFEGSFQEEWSLLYESLS